MTVSATRPSQERTDRPTRSRDDRPGGSPRRRATRSFAPLWLLTPAGLVLVFVTIAPIVFLVFTSFTDYDQRSLYTGAYDAVGLAQYVQILTDPAFWASLVRTILFTAAMVLGSILIGAGVSHLMTRLGVVLRYAVTIVLICAWGMPNVASSLVWNWLFQPGYGVVNWMLTQLHVFGDMTNTDWGNSAGLAYTSIWMLVVWQAVPFIALTLYAAETQIPLEVKEAVRLDGGSEWTVYRVVTIEYLRPTLLLVTMLSIIWDFNVFNQIWLVSQGGPDGATSTLGVFTYITAFVGHDIGTGSAVAVISALILMVLSALYIRNLVRSGEEL
ncbi:sugar ABC transporter permease [Curtobacterium sp. MCPF17_011]|uniref:carbohydrate ABC transporter permease n=1 Tax=Curtobacterium sp. MCPF17_011 TaxID=2175652 RepID=UPI000DA81711|nr:sugar ABC transporter permease [Curtobacterium sp. MCPF17_011]PZF15485.1 sugar ABC transporter permease [Curtobacterium sp. MCPF17_011]